MVVLDSKSTFVTGQHRCQLPTSEESGSMLKTWMLLTSVRIIFVTISLYILLIYTDRSCTVKFDSILLNVLHSIEFECVTESLIWSAAEMFITIMITALNLWIINLVTKTFLFKSTYLQLKAY